MTYSHEITLYCDMTCPYGLKTRMSSVTEARRYARDRGWRQDKAGRDVCPAHPKLKGAR
jgi:hypothetical protein